MAATLPSLLKWFSDVEITIQPEIEIRADDSGSLGVFALQDIPEGSTLCDIPKTALLSIANCSLASLIQQEELAGGLALSLAVMYERALGKESRWAPYLASLAAEGEYLPMFWPEEERGWLEGTEAEGRGDRDRNFTKEDYEMHVKPLFKKHKDLFKPSLLPKLRLEDFRVAASWVSSRDFGVDEGAHGDSMVPLADIFNHKASIVRLGGGWEVMGGGQGPEGAAEGEAAPISAADVDPRWRLHIGICDVGGDSDEEEGEGEGEGEEGPEEAAGSDAEEAGASEEDEEGSEEGEDGSGSEGEGPLDLASLLMGSLRIVAASDLKKGQEVFNTYGEHGNAELLCKYGFCLDENPFSLVKLAPKALREEAQKALGAKAAKPRIKFLEDQTHCLDLDEDGDPIEDLDLLQGGRISGPLQVALCVLGASDFEVRRWKDADAPVCKAKGLPIKADVPEDPLLAPAACDAHASGKPGKGQPKPGRLSKAKDASGSDDDDNNEEEGDEEGEGMELDSAEASLVLPRLGPTAARILIALIDCRLASYRPAVEGGAQGEASRLEEAKARAAEAGWPARGPLRSEVGARALRVSELEILEAVRSAAASQLGPNDASAAAGVSAGGTGVAGVSAAPRGTKRGHGDGGDGEAQRSRAAEGGVSAAPAAGMAVGKAAKSKRQK